MKIMKFNKKKVIPIVLIAFLAGGFFIVKGIKGQGDVGVFVNTTPVSKGEIEKTITLKAPLEGTSSAEVVSTLHYEVISLNVSEGDKVKKGQVLAVLDSTDLEKEISDAKDELELLNIKLDESIADAQKDYDTRSLKAQEDLEQKQRDYESAFSELSEEKRNLKNLEALLESGGTTSEEVKKAQADVEDLQRKVDSYNVVYTAGETAQTDYPLSGKVILTDAEEKELQTLSFGELKNGKVYAKPSDLKSIEISKSALEKKLSDLEDCQIKSPIDGTITRVNIKKGRFADETDNDKPMFVIENIDDLRMKVLVSEYDIAQIEVGQKAAISADVLGDETVSAVVSGISPTGEEKSGTTERVIPIFISITEKNEKLIAGINAKAKIEISKVSDAFSVPLEAVLFNDDGSKSIYLVDESGKVHILSVETGVENDLNVQVISDTLKEGDKIILSPTPDLTDGMEVKDAQDLGEI